MANCNDCIHISNTEEDQLINKYAEHRCNEYYIKVFHRGSKYNRTDFTIHPCKICSGTKFVKREGI